MVRKGIYNKINMTDARQTMMAEEEIVASKRRFGLFSQPPPLAVGDDSLFQTKTAKKGEDGKPITQPGNMLASACRSGVGKKAYLQTPESIYINDPYHDAFQKEIQYYNRMHSKSAMHETDFIPASGTKTIMNSAYNHIQEKQFTQKVVKKDENGRVKTQPANILTNSMSKVDSKIFKQPKYIPSNYNRSQEIAKQQRLIWRSKIKHQAMFKSMAFGNKTFTKNRQQYGIDDQTKKMIQKKQSSQIHSNIKIVQHEAKFKLARKGHGDPIGRYPVYIPPKTKTEPAQKIPRSKNSENGQKQEWKPTTFTQTRPTPSISLNPKLLRKQL